MMNTNLNLPAGYTVLSEEEMTYTEGGSAILTGLVAVTSTIGFGVLAQPDNKQGNFFTVLGRAFDDIGADMKQSASNALRDGVSVATLVALAPLSAILLLRK